MRIALVNDLRIALAALRRIVESMPDAELAWTALDGQQALERCRTDTPDLILMDMIMPVMDGVESTRRIMQECPCPIVVVTATVEGNADPVFEALGHGALDAVNTPVLGTCGALTGAEDLIRKIRAVQRLTRPSPAPQAPAAPAQSHRHAAQGPTLVAIGSSTGGPQALVKVLAALPNPLTVAVAIVQHIDIDFAPGLAQWLAGETGHTIQLIKTGQALVAGAVGLAATRDHLILDRGGLCRYVTEPEKHAHRPSVDVFFDSLLTAPLPSGVAVLLTGMGQDGAGGMLALRRAGWHTIAQDRATSVVWGMPGAAVKLDAAAETLPVELIGAALHRWALSRHNTSARGERNP